MKARHKDTGEIIELAEEGIISCDGRRFCWYQVELIPEPIDDFNPSLPDNLEESEKPMNQNELGKEINRYLEPIHTADIQFEPFTQMTKCARHFAEWGAEHARE